MTLDARFWIELSVALVAAFVIGTLVEYVVHRLMHTGKMLGRKHAEHHQDGFGQGWLGEFADYFLPSIVILWLGFLWSTAAGIGFALGGTLYAAAAAYSHQLQHDRPELCFWLKRPVHYLHHKHRMWRHNFGILVDVWDRVFGTYRPVDWNPQRRPFQHPLADFFRIRWY